MFPIFTLRPLSGNLTSSGVEYPTHPENRPYERIYPYNS
jgi:hypothetical protein